MNVDNLYYSESELRDKGIIFGTNVKISKKVSIYTDSLKLGSNIRIDDFCILTGKIKIGSFCHISNFCSLNGGAGIEIGNFSNLSAKTALLSQSDDFLGESLVGPLVPSNLRNLKAQKIIIKDHVVVGTNSVLLPGVILHEGISVGAMSLVKESFPSWKVVAGVPAKIIKDKSKKAKSLVEDKLFDV